MKLTEKKATLLMRLFLLFLTAVVGLLFGAMVAKSGLAGIATLTIGVIWGFNFKKLIAMYKEMWSPKWS